METLGVDQVQEIGIDGRDHTHEKIKEGIEGAIHPVMIMTNIIKTGHMVQREKEKKSKFQNKREIIVTNKATVVTSVQDSLIKRAKAV